LWILNKDKLINLIKGIFLVIIFSSILSYIRNFLPFEAHVNTQNINAKIHLSFFTAIVPLLLSPIVEEWIFRKWFPNTFQDTIGKRKAIVLSNILFSLFHLDIYFIPYLVNGLIYSWYFEKTKDIKIPILMHVIYNIFVFLTTYLT